MSCAMLLQSLAWKCAAASTRLAICCVPPEPRSFLRAPVTIAVGTAGIPGKARASAGS